MAVNIEACDTCCVTLQAQLEDIQRESATPNANKQTLALIGALASTENKGTFEVLQRESSFGRPASGNDCKVSLRYYEPSCESSSTSYTSVCDASTDRGYTVECADVTVTGYRQLEGSWNKQDMRCICEGHNQRAARELTNAARNLMRDITNDVATLMIAQSGSYQDGTNSNVAPVTLNLLNGDGHVNPAALSSVRSQHRQMYADGPAFMVAGEYTFIAQDVYQHGGTGTGLPNPALLNPSSNLRTLVDYEAETAFQTFAADALQHMLSWSPGAVQFLEWFEYVTEYEESGWDYTSTIIEIEGWLFDLEVNYSKCDKIYQWKLSKYFDIFNLPEASYAPCMTGNHILHWLLGCGDFDCSMYLV